MKSTPHYMNPPVVETVIGVQFPELPGFRSAHFGLYWETIKDKGYAKTEDKPRLTEVSEPFPRRLIPAEATLHLGSTSVPQRAWYTAASESELVQLQPDRFLFNWRKQEGEEYPSYTENSKKFLKEFEGFLGFCRQERLDDPKPNLCEVTYVNHIFPVDDESAVDLFGKVFAGLRWQVADQFLPNPEGATFNRAYVIGEQKGRLYAEASVAYQSKEQKEFVFLKLTGRVNHPSGDCGKVAESLQLAHDWVVNGFASITEIEIQDSRWERMQ